MTEYLQGIDVSRYQGKMDWEKAKNAGVKFAFIKATEGLNYTDPQYRQNVNGAKDAGIPFGIYHFWRSTVAPISQCDNIMRAYDYLDDDVPIVLDVEVFDGLTPSQNKGILQLLIQGIFDRVNFLPTIYTRKSIWDANVEEYSRWKELPLWVAHYGVSKPAIPRDWQDWMVWQYTSNGSGVEYGTEKDNIDLNYVKQAYLDYYANGVPLPEPVPEPEQKEYDISITLDGVTYSGKVRKEI